MVEFGPRLTASAAHGRYVDWLSAEFERAGLHLLPRTPYETDRWLAQQVGLDILEGSGAGAVDVATYYPRSAQTPPRASRARWSTEARCRCRASAALTSAPWRRRWRVTRASSPRGRAGSPGLLEGGPSGSILLVDLPMPVPLTAAASCRWRPT